MAKSDQCFFKLALCSYGTFSSALPKLLDTFVKFVKCLKYVLVVMSDFHVSSPSKIYLKRRWKKMVMVMMII